MVNAPADAKNKLPAKTYTLKDFQEFSARKHNRQLLEATREALATLSGSGQPSLPPDRRRLRGVGFQVDPWAHGRRGGETPGSSPSQRRDMLEYRDKVADYMNWYEATQAATQSGSFEDYFHTVRQLDDRQPVHRPDPISVYLDGAGDGVALRPTPPLTARGRRRPRPVSSVRPAGAASTLIGANSGS